MTVSAVELYGPTYTLSEAGALCGIPERTLWRWRAQSLLTTTPDWEGDFAGLARVLEGKGEIRMITPAQFAVEDIARLMVISHLGATYGCDRLLLLQAIGHPYSIDIQPGDEPDWLLIYPDAKGNLTRRATRDSEEVARVIGVAPSYVVPLSGFRNAAVRATRKLAEKPEIRKRRLA